MKIIAYKVKSREEKNVEELNSSVTINIDADFFMKKQIQRNEKKYKCTCCGGSWDNRKTHFSKSSSPLYQSNDGYLTICNECRDKYFFKLVDLYSGNEAHAMRHMCQQFDIIFHIDALNASRQVSSDKSRFAYYLQKKNLGQTARAGTTYIDGIKYDWIHREDDIIESVEQIKQDDISVKATTLERWGLGFSEMDYKVLEDHYKMLKKNNPNCDNNQEIFIKSLCNINMLMVRALRDGDSDKYVKLTDQYSKTFTKAGLKTIQEIDNSANESMGVTLSVIAQYTPEEYYKDKKLYDDFDGLGSYFTRFVRRPLKNLMTGSTERDKEFYVKDKSGDNDE